MQNLIPTRIIARRGRDAMIIGALLIMAGLVGCGIGGLFVIIFSSRTGGLIFFLIGGLIGLAGIGFMVRGLTYRRENLGAMRVAEVLSRELDTRYTFVRNLSRRGLGYIDAVLIGPPGALVFRTIEREGVFRNEGADWLERRGNGPLVLSRMNATRECVTDIYALRKYLARYQLAQVPVYGIVVFTSPQVQLSARQPVVPIAELRTLTTALRRDFLAESRLDDQTVEHTVSVLYT